MKLSKAVTIFTIPKNIGEYNIYDLKEDVNVKSHLNLL